MKKQLDLSKGVENCGKSEVSDAQQFISSGIKAFDAILAGGIPSEMITRAQSLNRSCGHEAHTEFVRAMMSQEG